MEKEKYTVLELMGEFDYPPEILVKPKVWNKTIVNEKGKTQFFKERDEGIYRFSFGVQFNRYL